MNYSVINTPPPIVQAKRLTLLFAAMVLSSLVATLPQSIAFFQSGQHIGLEEGGFLRFIREGIWFFTLMYVFFLSFSMNFDRVISNGLLSMAFFMLFVFIVCTLWSLVFLESNYLIVLGGIRAIIYIPAVYVGYLVFTLGKEKILSIFLKLLSFYLLVQLAFSVFQALFSAGPAWQQTFFGGRAHGTFSNYNTFGSMIVACALWFAYGAVRYYPLRFRNPYQLMLLLTVGGSLLSGSRTSIICSVLLCLFPLYERTLRGRFAGRLLLMTAPALIFLLNLYLSQSAAIIGREGVDPYAGGRVQHWVEVFLQADTPGELILGQGVGSSSSASSQYINFLERSGQAAILGDGLTAAGNAHSVYIFMLGNFGLLGLGLYILALIASFLLVRKTMLGMFLVTVILIGFPLSFVEFHPTAPLIFALWGVLIAEEAEARRVSTPRT